MSFVSVRSASLIKFFVALAIVMAFLRDYLTVADFFIRGGSVAYWSLEIESNYLSYIKDVGLILSLFFLFFLMKNSRNFFYFFLFLTVNLFLGLFLVDENSMLVGLASELRIIVLLFYLYFILLIADTLNMPDSIDVVEFAMRLYVFMASITAFVTIVQFVIVGSLFGYRLMGLFSQAALNSYVMLGAFLILSVLYMNNKYSNNFYYFSSIFLVPAIMFTGARVAVVASLFVFSLVVMSKLRIKKDVFSYIFLFFVFCFIVFFAVGLSVLVADRGGLSESGSTRIDIMQSILSNFYDISFFNFFFGGGVGFGTNLVAAYAGGSIYDGTLNFLLARFGLLAFLVLIFIFFVFLNTLKKIKVFYFSIIYSCLFLVGVSVNVFEQSIFLMAIVLCVAYVDFSKRMEPEYFNGSHGVK